MIPCKHCNTPNSLDSTFCKRCGTGLPEEEISTARAKLEKIVEEGVHALNVGKLEESMAIAETAVTADPSMASAYSLKASVHERKGQIAEALECAERLVELNPDSELDKIKRNQLRAALGASALNSRGGNRGIAAIAGFSAAVIALCGIVLGGQWLIKKQVQPRVALNSLPPRSEQPSNSLVQPPIVPPNTNSGAQQPPVVQTPVTPAPNSEGQNVFRSNQRGGQDSGNSDDQSEPSPIRTKRGVVDEETSNLSPLNKALEVHPDFPIAPLTNSTKNSPPAQISKHNDGDPNPMPEPLKPNTQVNDPGQIEIKVHEDPGAPRRNSLSSGGQSGQESPKDTGKVYMKMGNDYFQMGNYSGAASSLERAVSNGADPVRANVRLAQSYSSLGKKSEAAEAYKKAIAAASSSLSSGKGDSAKLKAVRDAAEAALHQIQGG